MNWFPNPGYIPYIMPGTTTYPKWVPGHYGRPPQVCPGHAPGYKYCPECGKELPVYKRCTVH